MEYQTRPSPQSAAEFEGFFEELEKKLLEPETAQDVAPATTKAELEKTSHALVLLWEDVNSDVAAEAEFERKYPRAGKLGEKLTGLHPSVYERSHQERAPRNEEFCEKTHWRQREQTFASYGGSVSTHRCNRRSKGQVKAEATSNNDVRICFVFARQKWIPIDHLRSHQ